MCKLQPGIVRSKLQQTIHYKQGMVTDAGIGLGCETNIARVVAGAGEEVAAKFLAELKR